MKHNEPVGITAPLHSEACFRFQLGIISGAHKSQRDLARNGIRAQNLTVVKPALCHGTIQLFRHYR